jgi:hypothetical protein
LFDVSEIHKILQAFSTDTSIALREKVLRALSGPVAPLQEQPKNNIARNAMFELSLAAGWKNAGASVKLGEPDIQLTLGQKPFLVECKRPFYGNTVVRNIKEAASTLRNEFEKLGDKDVFGIVAISLSRLYVRGDKPLKGPKGEGRRVMKDKLAELIEQNSREWRVKRFRGFHERIVAVMFHLAAPWDEDGERLINLSAVNFVQAGKSAVGWNALTLNMSSLQE